MKKLIIIIGGLLILTGCTNNKCDCDNAEIVKNNTVIVDKLQSFKIKITGDYTGEINYPIIKELKLQQISLKTKNPLSNSTKKIIGLRLNQILAKMQMTSDIKSITFMNDTTSIKYSIDNITDYAFLVLFVDGVELDKPMLAKINTTTNYWIDNLEEIHISKD